MLVSNLRALTNILMRKPQFISVATANLSHQLLYKLGGSCLNGWSHPPEVINAFITDICNLGCRECHYAYSDKPGFSLNQVGHMQPTIFRKFMDEIPGRPVVSFTGGEPLLHPDVVDLIAYAKQKGRFCTLVTNGWHLAEKAHELCESGLDLLCVSVDGPRETHNSIRGKKSFERLDFGLETILKKSNRPVVFISVTISDLNFDKLPLTYELAKGWGVDGLNFNHLWMQTDEMVQELNSRFSLFPGDHIAWEVNNDNIDVNYLYDSLAIIRDASWGGKMVVIESPYLNRQEITDWYRSPQKPVRYNTVRCGWIRMKLWADGKVKPCRDYEVGDITETHAEAIWNGNEYQEFRRLLAEEGMLPICTRCCFMAHR
jgi:MoaA/NifB/PqqE/SkfB family radical SAM enzyme